jgi:uncharacterized protein YyaL (SSP411 family)
MNDQLGGGFHRYSVDERWFVPHFEKMLYDQAQLAISYLEAFQATADPQYAATARRILDYVERDMTGLEGGFYSAEDADSVIAPDHPDLKGEGAFYIWSIQEIQALLPAQAAEWFCYRYGVEAAGNVENDPHDEFNGKNILWEAHTEEETAQRFAQTTDRVREALGQAESVLLQARSTRVRPHLDDKILTSWNGLMISAFAMAGAVLEEPRYAAAARRAAEFLIAHLYNASTGVLLRRYRQGDAAIPGFLDDYALFVQGLLDLYEAQFDLRHLELAVRLTEKQCELFEDPEQGAFFSSPAGDTSLVLRVKEDYDGAEPSGNSVAVLNLLRLAQMTNRPGFRKSAEKSFAAFASRLSHVPVAMPQMLAACEWILSQPREIILVGEKEAVDTRALLRVLRRRFVPNRILLLVDSPETQKALAAGIPSIESMTKLAGRAGAYVCRNYTCQLPVSEADRFAELIQ